MITNDKLCKSCTGRIRVIISDLMLADYDEGHGGILPPAVAKAVNDLLGLLPPTKKEDDDE